MRVVEDVTTSTQLPDLNFLDQRGLSKLQKITLFSVAVLQDKVLSQLRRPTDTNNLELKNYESQIFLKFISNISFNPEKNAQIESLVPIFREFLKSDNRDNLKLYINKLFGLLPFAIAMQLSAEALVENTSPAANEVWVNAQELVLSRLNERGNNALPQRRFGRRFVRSAQPVIDTITLYSYIGVNNSNETTTELNALDNFLKASYLIEDRSVSNNLKRGISLRTKQINSHPALNLDFFESMLAERVIRPWNF